MMNPFGSTSEMLILKLLHEHGELYGAQFVHFSNNQLKRATIYITLGRMEEKRLVKTRPGARPSHVSQLRRPMYSLTKEGAKRLQDFMSMFANASTVKT